MTTLEIDFLPTNDEQGCRMPYIRETPIDYKCDGIEGQVTFNGYYYVEDHEPPFPEDEALPVWMRQRHSAWLPQKVKMYAKLRETEPYLVERNEAEMWTRYHYKTLEENAYVVEIYKRVKHECTNTYSDEIDPDGEEMKICFFSTDKQTIYFRVLEKL